MIKLKLIVIQVLLLLTIGCKQLPDPVVSDFNEDLAVELRADEMGMKTYVVAFLKAGPNRNQDSATVVEIQKGHMANINRLAEEGKLVLAGPFLDGGEFRGIFVFNVETLEEAKELTETDPAIQSGRLIMELHTWYGSAAVQEVNKIHSSIARKSF